MDTVFVALLFFFIGSITGFFISALLVAASEYGDDIKDEQSK